MSKTVTVLSTRDNQRKQITTSATNWGELRTAIESEGISVEGMKVMVRETKATLEHKDAQLPDGNFTIFLTPGKVKSGK